MGRSKYNLALLPGICFSVATSLFKFLLVQTVSGAGLVHDKCHCRCFYNECRVELLGKGKRSPDDAVSKSAPDLIEPVCF